MSQQESSDKLQAARDYLHQLFTLDERRELEVAIGLIDQELAESGAPAAPAAGGRRAMLPEPEDELLTPEAFEESERARVRDRERERRRRAQMQLEQLTAERVQALKSDLLAFEEQRLEALDRKDREVAEIDTAVQNLEARSSGVQRRREQTLKDEQTLRDELTKRQKLIREDDKSLEEIREHVARLRRELEAATKRESELVDNLSRNQQRVRNEESALAEIQLRRTQMDENERQAAQDLEALRKQRDGLLKDYTEQFRELEDTFLRAHWSKPPISDDHLRECLKASITLLNQDESTVRARIRDLDLGDNLQAVRPEFDAPVLGESAPEPVTSHASLQQFLKIVKA